MALAGSWKTRPLVEMKALLVLGLLGRRRRLGRRLPTWTWAPPPRVALKILFSLGRATMAASLA